MRKNFLSFLLVLFFFGCGPKLHFVKVGKEEYPKKPIDYEVIVFFHNEKPERV
jgi:hypothetical protein